jgi:dihydroxyacetone kinase-like protein
MEAVEKTVAETPGPSLKELFSKVAWAAMSCDGGSTGPLLGSFFMGMSDGVADKTELDHAGVLTMFEAGVTKLAKQSRAKVGDKTMMDAFLPALDALKASASATGIKGAWASAAEAAAKGSDATKTMRAKFGRARNLGDRVLGHTDPGSVSIALILKGFTEGLS